MKAKGIVAIKGSEIFIIFIKINKEVYFNFGTNDWFTIEDFTNLHRHSNPKIKRHAESPKFKKDYKETLEVIETSKDYLEMNDRFVKDFKKDRGFRIKEFNLEVEDGATSFKW